MTHRILTEAEKRMKAAIEATLHDFQKIRTGRANPSILEDVRVDYYGTETPLNQVGNVSVPEPRQLMITPYDRSMLPMIEKAIQRSDLGVTPMNDGQNIRINFPPMTEDRRKDLVKQVNHRAEEGCVSVRQARREALDEFKQLEKDKEISEDDHKRYEKQVQELTDKYVAEVHKLQEVKDAELMEI